MNSTSTAAGLLAAALLAAPPPRRRLMAPESRRRIASTAGWTVVLLATAFIVSASPTVAVAAGLVTAAILRRRRRRIRDCRRRSEGEAMTTALDVLVGELRVGAHPLQAFAIAAAESPGKAGESLRAVVTRAQLGADVAAGLRASAADSSVPAYWDRLAVCWELAVRHGLAMSTLMLAAHRDIVGRRRYADQVHAGLAGTRATATILATLPFLGLTLGELIGARPVRFLLSGGGGGWLLVVGVGLVGIGVAWSDRIIDRLTP